MRYNMDRFRGIFVALNAVYDRDGELNEPALRKLANWYKEKGITGLYVCGSTGEGIVMSMDERKRTLEILADELGDSLTLLVHVGAPSTRDAVELAKHAAEHGAHGTSAVPSIYYGLPENAIAAHWNAIADAADIPFVIYNIPGCTNYSLTPALFTKMLENDHVCGLKNSSMPCMDITVFKSLAPEGFVIFNGPDEQLAAGLAMGADGGIGGTYGTMPEVYVTIYKLMQMGAYKEAFELQRRTTMVIVNDLLSLGSLYSTAKLVIRARSGINIGDARMPLPRVDHKNPRIAGITKAVEDHVAYALETLAACEKKYK
jgi:N-acetylneuraminate lyase